jgi:hypothetical protein
MLFAAAASAAASGDYNETPWSGANISIGGDYSSYHSRFWDVHPVANPAYVEGGDASKVLSVPEGNEVWAVRGEKFRPRVSLGADYQSGPLVLGMKLSFDPIGMKYRHALQYSGAPESLTFKSSASGRALAEVGIAPGTGRLLFVFDLGLQYGQNSAKYTSGTGSHIVTVSTSTTSMSPVGSWGVRALLSPNVFLEFGGECVGTSTKLKLKGDPLDQLSPYITKMSRPAFGAYMELGYHFG